MKSYLYPVFAAALLLSSVTCAGAADEPQKTVSPQLEKFFKKPQFRIAVLSPDQKSLAVTTAVQGVFHLAVLDIETNKITHLAGFDDANVCSVRWINNDRLIFDLEDLESPHDKAKCGNGLFAVNRDGTKFSELMGTVRKQIDRIEMAARQNGSWDPTVSLLHFVDSFPDDSGDILVEKSASHSSDDHGLFKFNTLTFRKREILNGLPGQPQGFITDSKQQLRVVIARAQKEGFENIWYRDTPSEPWKKILERDNFRPEFTIMGFDSDDKTMYVNSRAGGDKWGVYKFDFAENKVGEKVVDDPTVDVGDGIFDGSGYGSGMVFDDNTRKLQGIRIQSEPPKTYWIDADFAKAQEEVDTAFPDRKQA